jgi:hypothetical protein
MKIKRMAGTFGFGAIWHKATRTIMFALFGYAITFAFPRPGACKFCGHGPELHSATRAYGFTEWSCHGDKKTCECEHYEPVRLQPQRDLPAFGMKHFNVTKFRRRII